MELIDKFTQPPKFMVCGEMSYIHLSKDKVKSVQLQRITRIFLGPLAESNMLNFFKPGEIWYINKVEYDEIIGGFGLIYWKENESYE